MQRSKQGQGNPLTSPVDKGELWIKFALECTENIKHKNEKKNK